MSRVSPLLTAACTFLAAVVITPLGAAQAPQDAAPTGSPAAVLRAGLAALAQQRWTDMAALVHPEALRQFQQEQLAFAQEWHDSRTREPVRDSTVPRVVAEYLTKQWNEAMGPREPATLGFARVNSLDELKALSSLELFARWLEGHWPQPGNYAGGTAPTWIRTVVGTVAENDSMAHVVYRVQVDLGGRLAPAQMEVVTLRRLSGVWRIVLNDDLAFQGSIGAITLVDPE